MHAAALTLPWKSRPSRTRGLRPGALTTGDGAIVPPPDLRSGVSYVRLVQKMLDRGWSTERVQNVLGRSFLRSFARLRP